MTCERSRVIAQEGRGCRSVSRRGMLFGYSYPRGETFHRCLGKQQSVEGFPEEVAHEPGLGE